MSVPDEMLGRYELLLGLLTEEQIAEQNQLMQSGQLHPRDIKANLGRYVVSVYHSQQEATEAEEAFTRQFRNKEIPDDIPEVTLPAGAEHNVLALIVEGLTNKEIGRALSLSPRTVETHRANLFAKLQVDNLAHLIRHYASLVSVSP